MKTVMLECPCCKGPLSYITYEESDKKTIGCMKCSGRPVVSHTDLNVVFEKLEEMVA